VDWLLLVLRLLAVAVLYLFLALAVYVIWLELKVGGEGRTISAPEETLNLSSVSAPEAFLEVVEPPSTSVLSVPKHHLLPRTLVGRDKVCDIVLVDDCVSQRHAQIVAREGHWWLSDLDSRNGTFLNGEAVDGSVTLRHSDRIGIGKTVLAVHLKANASKEIMERRPQWNPSDWA
jgi:hypothetical protein